MSYILLVVVFFVLAAQHSRIRAIEDKLKAGASPAKQARTEAVPAIQETVEKPVPQTQTVVANESSEELSGRLLGRIGIAAVIIGVAFFLKYAFDNNWVGPAGRVMIGVMIGIALLGIGQWLRAKYLAYSDLLMGGGLAVLYLSVYASYALYSLTDPVIAFLGLAIVTAFGVGMSIMNATQTLAVVSVLGAYLTPALIGVDLIGATVVFGYLTILNIGILAILIYKKWTPLVIIGLSGTWIHFGGWYASSYSEALLVPTLFFVAGQFALFTAAGIWRLITEKHPAEALDYMLLGSNALIFSAVAYSILAPSHIHAASLGAVACAVVYGGIALFAYKRNPTDRSLNIFLPGIAVSFLTAAIAIEFSGPWVAAWWFVESIVIYAIASKSSSRGFQVMGVIVYILGLIKLLAYIVMYSVGSDFVLIYNGPFVMTMFAAFTAYTIAYMYYHYGSVSAEIRDRGMAAFVVIANILTIYALTSQVTAYYSLQMRMIDMTGASVTSLQNSSNIAVSILWSLYAAILTVIGFAKKHPSMRRLGLALFIITACKVVVDVWSLGEIYRIISFIIFGIIALGASFMYVKYKDRLKGIV